MNDPTPTLLAYLLREDGAWYALGLNYQWRASFAVFPGPADGSVWLTPEDSHLLAIRLDGYEPELLEQIAADIIRWGQGKRLRFMTELEIESDARPTPITGSLLDILFFSSVREPEQNGH